MIEAVFLQIIIIIAVILILFKLVMAVFRIAKALESIDDTLYQIYKQLDEKDQNGLEQKKNK